MHGEDRSEMRQKVYAESWWLGDAAILLVDAVQDFMGVRVMAEMPEQS